MRKKKVKQETAQNITQSAVDWTDITTNPPPYYKIISLKLKSGQVIDDCARIPDQNGDYYVGALGKDIKDVIQWRDFEWQYPSMDDKKHKKR